jgi:hypothetical protein
VELRGLEPQRLPEKTVPEMHLLASGVVMPWVIVLPLCVGVLRGVTVLALPRRDRRVGGQGVREARLDRGSGVPVRFGGECRGGGAAPHATYVSRPRAPAYRTVPTIARPRGALSHRLSAIIFREPFYRYKY